MYKRIVTFFQETVYDNAAGSSKNVETSRLVKCRLSMVSYCQNLTKGRVVMQKLLIADSSEPFTAALTNALCKDFQIQVCPDGETALELLLSFRPDVLILNLQLPYKDGLTVLQEAAFLPEHILATTSFLSPYVERCAAALGVTYAMITPSVTALRVRVMDMVQQNKTALQPEDLPAATITHLHILSLKTSVDGYRQLCEAIPLFYMDSHQLLSKELYPAVAAKCGCKDSRSVEHSIRKAIEAAWETRNKTVWEKYFPGYKKCPTNKQFISKIAEMLKK